jgi:hypothetical protein
VLLHTCLPAVIVQAGANVSLVLISRAQPSALGLLGLLPGIVALPFPAYTEAQLVDILASVRRCGQRVWISAF